MNQPVSRRSALARMSGGAAAFMAATSFQANLRAAEVAAGGGKLKGRINPSVCKWCYNSIPLEDFCRSSKEIGLQSVELLEVKDFATLKQHDLVCAMVSGVPGGITKGLNRPE